MYKGNMDIYVKIFDADFINIGTDADFGGVNWIGCLQLTIIPILWDFARRSKSNIEEIM